MEVGLVGPGRVGRALTELLPGDKFRLTAVLSRTLTSARRAVREMEIGTAVADPDSFADCRVVLVSVPDAALPAVARRFRSVRFSWDRRVVLHTSGMCDSSVFEALRARGAAIGSMHPLFVFQRPAPTLAGVHFAVEGCPAAATMARRLVRAWGGEFQLVKPEHKIHHSIARTLASDLLTGLVEAAVQQMVAGGFSRRRGYHAVSRVLGAAQEDYARSGRSSRPGPLLSDAAAIIRRQIDALEEVDLLLAADYRAAARQTLRALRRETKAMAFLFDAGTG